MCVFLYIRPFFRLVTSVCSPSETSRTERHLLFLTYQIPVYHIPPGFATVFLTILHSRNSRENGKLPPFRYDDGKGASSVVRTRRENGRAERKSRQTAGSFLPVVPRPFVQGTAASAEPRGVRPLVCNCFFALPAAGSQRGVRPPGGTCFLPWRPREHGRPVFCPVICIISVSQWRLPALRRWRGAWSAVRARLPPRRREPWRQSLRFRVFLRCGQCLQWSF